MNRLAIGAMMLLVLGPALHARDDPKDKPKNEKADKAAEKPKTPAEQYRQIISEQQKAMQDFMKVYREAKTDADRQKAFEKYPNPQKVSGRMLEIAEKNPKDDAAVDALVWIVQNASNGKEGTKALSLLTKGDYIENQKVGQVCLSLIYSQSADAEKLMRAVVEKNPHHDAKGMATLALAQYLKQKSERPNLKPADMESMNKEAESLFAEAASKYGDVKSSRGKLGDTAKQELFEIRNLAIGKVAPDIDGEDSGGKKFKLSDYRGKVVVLDFWARW